MKRKYFASMLVFIILLLGITCISYIKDGERQRQEPHGGNELNYAGVEADNIIGNGNLKSIKYDLASDYHSLKVENNKTNMIIRVSTETSSVTVTSDSNLLEHIKTELKKDTLSILVDENIQPTAAIICDIGIKPLFRIGVKGDGDVKFEGILTGKQLSIYDLGEMDITHSGTGGLDLTIDAVHVKFNGDNSRGNVVIKGKCLESFSMFDTAQGGKFDISELASPDIHVDGSGVVIATPQRVLNVSLKEPGEVLYVKNKLKPLVIRNFTGPYQEVNK